MKNLKTLIAATTLLFAMASCSSDSNSSSSTGSTMQISARATYVPTAGRLNDAIDITSFKVNIREIEFEVADETGNHEHHEHNGHDNGHMDGDNDHNFFNSDDTTELQGPWEFDLLNQTLPVTTLTVPNGTYEEVEFKLSPSLVSTSPIYNKTVEVTGTINGTPFVFWHNLNEKLKIDYEDTDQNLVIANGTYDLIFNFDLNEIFSHIDLGTAVDGNGNGTIEIGPDDTDGNNGLATQLHEHIGGGCHMHDGPHHN
ncbi:DUF4382 domain-containing protein [Flavobacterium sp.]|uniref:DUF4382 domain-containing protein n=1 Tax=Flavobacterium sp. TaxID=239 RepID=UPI00286BE96D|nr:DUF4382 domain-containing protein [Flavobacterium sp.]